jgi:predicted transcriptional regulator
MARNMELRTMMSRRSKFEIYIDILNEIKSGTVIPTRIMYGANLSWKPLKQILSNFIAQGLIVEQVSDDGDKRRRKVYALTEKGDNVLKYFSKVKGLLELEKAVQIRD